MPEVYNDNLETRLPLFRQLRRTSCDVNAYDIRRTFVVFANDYDSARTWPAGLLLEVLMPRVGVGCSKQTVRCLRRAALAALCRQPLPHSLGRQLAVGRP